MCLDRLHLGNFGLENRIKQAKNFSHEKLIIQADGYPSVEKMITILLYKLLQQPTIINKAFNMELNKKEKKKILYKKERSYDHNIWRNKLS